MTAYNIVERKPTFNLLLKRASEEDGHSPDPLLLRQKTVAVFVKCSEHCRPERREVSLRQESRERERCEREGEKKERETSVHKEVIAHVKMVVQ